jgi:hypothetical protein
MYRPLNLITIVFHTLQQNNSDPMSKLVLVIVMMLMAGRNNAQNYPAPSNEPLTYFVLIMADDGQAFYVRLNNQLYNSSPAGHLILSQLRDSAYTIAVGFPGRSFPEQRFLMNIHEKDWALHLIRQDNRWGLYDGQGQALAAVDDTAGAQGPLPAGVKKDDAFSQLMSAIVQDTTVMYNTYVAAADTFASSSTVPPSSTSPPPSSTSLLPSHTSALSSSTPLMSSPTSTLPAPTGVLPSSTATLPAPTGVLPSSTSPLPAPTAAPPSSTATLPASTASPSLSPNQSSVKRTDSLSQGGTSASFDSDPAAPSSPTGVVKLSERRSAQSLSMVFADHPGHKRVDTIDVVIPVDSPATFQNPSQTYDTSQSTAPLYPPRTSKYLSPSSDTSRSGVTRRPRDPNATRHPQLSKSEATAQSPAVRRSKSPDTTQSSTAHRSKSADTTQSTTIRRSMSPDTSRTTAANRPKLPDTSQSTAVHRPKLPDTSRTTAAHRSKLPDTSRSTVAHRPKLPDTSRSTATHRPKLLDTSRATVARRPQTPADTSHSAASMHGSLSPDTPHSGSRASRNPKTDTPETASSSARKSTLPFINSDCHAFATDYDVDKLRIHMLAANKDDDRIQTAYKVFKTKCFATSQLRALCELFSSDAAKFKFLATAYPFVSDDHFPELENLLSDTLYAGKFRNMTDPH